MCELKVLAALSEAVELCSLTSAADNQEVASGALMQAEQQFGLRPLARASRRFPLTSVGKMLVHASRPAQCTVRKVALTSDRLESCRDVTPTDARLVAVERAAPRASGRPARAMACVDAPMR